MYLYYIFRRKGKMKWKNIIVTAGLTGLLLTGCGSYQEEELESSTAGTQQQGDTEEIAANTPFGRYPETIEYTLGKMVSSDGDGLPNGDTYEDNPYTRYLKEKINVQNRDVIEGRADGYDQVTAMTILEGNLPDVMVIDNYQYLKIMVEKGLIEDLTPYYEKCASDRMKEIYNSYGASIFQNVMFDGKMMALPETNIYSQSDLLWVRQDWLDKLGLEGPKTMQDIETIIQQFIEKDPGNNGAGNTVGLVFDSNLLSAYNYSADLLFTYKGAHLRRWIQQEDGTVVYGSITPQAKAGLEYVRNLYERKIVDNNFLFYTSETNDELVINGQCGAFFGKWWAPNSPLMQAKEKNPEAEWMPYLIQTNEDGSTSFSLEKPSGKFVVVRKGYEHPEIIMKINSVLFDDLRYEDEGMQEIAAYYQNNIDVTARPCVINVDYSDALTRCYEKLTQVFNGRLDPEELPLLEHAYYEECKIYLEDPAHASSESWAAYQSRITACKALFNGNLDPVDSAFWGETDTMEEKWEELEALEKEVFLKIILGEQPLEYFDQFVEEWKQQGGETITNEINQYIQNDKAVSILMKN